MIDLFVISILVVFLALSIVFSQLPAVAAKLLGGDAATLGILQAASGAGALIGVLIVIPILQSLRRVGVALGLSLAWIGVWLLIFRQMSYGAELRRNQYPLALIIYYVPAAVLYVAVLSASYVAHARGRVAWKGREYATGTRRGEKAQWS